MWQQCCADQRYDRSVIRCTDDRRLDQRSAGHHGSVTYDSCVIRSTDDRRRCHDRGQHHDRGGTEG